MQRFFKLSLLSDMRHNKQAKNKKLIAESIELVATNGSMTGDVSPIPKKDGPESSFEVTETETEVAITVRYVVLHATKMRGDTSFARGISKSLRNNRAIHAYEDGGSLGMIDKNNQSTLSFSLHGLEDVIANAKAKGVRLGREKKRDSHLIRSLRLSGLTYREVGRIARCSSGCVASEIRQMKKDGLLDEKGKPVIQASTKRHSPPPSTTPSPAGQLAPSTDESQGDLEVIRF
jgi:hypothetical protein